MSDLQNHFNKFIEELEKKTEDFPKETIIQKKSNKLSKKILIIFKLTTIFMVLIISVIFIILIGVYINSFIKMKNILKENNIKEPFNLTIMDNFYNIKNMVIILS